MGNEQEHTKLYDERSFLIREAYMRWRRKAKKQQHQEEAEKLVEAFILAKQKKPSNRKKIIESTNLDKMIVLKAIKALIKAEYI